MIQIKSTRHLAPKQASSICNVNFIKVSDKAKIHPGFGNHRECVCYVNSCLCYETLAKRPLLPPAIGGMSGSNFARSEALALSSKYYMYSCG